MTDFDPRTVDLPLGHFIGGTITSGTTANFDVQRPSDGKAYCELTIGDPDLVDQVVTNAQDAAISTGWASGAPRERGRVMRRWADLVDEHSDRLAQLEALGSTRPVAQARAWDVGYVAETIRFFAELTDKHGGETAATAHDRLGFTLAEPYGVVAAIAPWNFPLVMAIWKISPAIAAGNAVVLKPSELTPLSAVYLARLASEAGLPAGIFNVVQGDGITTGRALCRHPDVSKVTFTGSTETGADIMSTCAAHGIKPVTLELGGKSPQLVFSDADIERAVPSIASGIMSNAGQVCVAGTRLIVHRSIRDEVVDKVAALMSQAVPGPTWKQSSAYSPIVSARQFERIDHIVAKSLTQGAEAIIGARQMDSPSGGLFYAPTMLTGVESDNPAVTDEIFGPVLTVQEFDGDEEGFALAGHPKYGLAAGVYTQDVSRALRAVRSIEAGTVWVNRYGRSEDLVIPTGGFKQSGIGKDLGRAAYESNMRIKSALIGL